MGSCAFSSRPRVRGGAGSLFPSARHRLARSGTPPCCPPRPSFAAPPPWADRRPAVAAQLPRSTAQENGDICTALRDYALKAAAQHIKHRGKSASTGRIAQYPSRFSHRKSPTPPVKTAHFRTKIPVFRPFSGRCDTICAKSTF